MKKVLKIFLISALSLIILILAVFTIITNKTLTKKMAPVLPRDNPASVEFVYDKSRDKLYDPKREELFIRRQPEEESFPRLKACSEVVSIISSDGLNLKAYLHRNTDNHNYMIFMHGHSDTPKMSSPFAMHFVDMGWNVLVPGQRGHGWSEGNFIDMGAFARFDCRQWIEFITDMDKDAKIVLFGVSMGAATVMMTTGLEIPSNVICCIEDCGYTSVYEQMKDSVEKLGLPAGIVMTISRILSKMKFGYDIKEISPLEAVKKSRTPTLFIHGAKDDYVPFWMQDKLYEAAACQKEKLVIQSAPHAVSAFHEPEKYWNGVDTFVKKYF